MYLKFIHHKRKEQFTSNVSNSTNRMVTIIVTKTVSTTFGITKTKSRITVLWTVVWIQSHPERREVWKLEPIRWWLEKGDSDGLDRSNVKIIWLNQTWMQMEKDRGTPRKTQWAGVKQDSKCLICNALQGAVGDGRPRPGAATWWTERNACVISDSVLLPTVYENMMTSTKQEVHNRPHCLRRRTKPRPEVTCTENLVKYKRNVFETWKQID